MHASSISVRFK